MNKDTKSPPKIAIIIPTLNEQDSIGLVINNLKKELQNFDHEIIVVDGKSSDNTVPIAKNLGVHVIYQKNKGYGEALFAGYFYASKELNCEILVTIDADGTYSALDCVKIIDKILSHDADYVIGRRLVNSENMTLSHRIGNRSISWLIRKSLHINLRDSQSGIFGFRSYLIDNIDLRQTGWAVNTEMLTKAYDLGMLIDEIDVSYSTREGNTKINTVRAGLTNLQVILRMMRDSNPILFLGLFGLGLIGLGTLFGILVVADYLETGIVNRPNLAVLSALLIMTGVQLFSLGLVADMMKKRQQVRLKISHNLYRKA